MVIDLVKYRKEQKFNKLYAKVDSEASYHIKQCDEAFCDRLCVLSENADCGNYDKATEMLVVMDKALHNDPNSFLWEYMYQALMTGHADLISGNFPCYGDVHSFLGTTAIVEVIDDLYWDSNERLSINYLLNYDGGNPNGIFMRKHANEVNDIFNRFFMMTGILTKDYHLTNLGSLIQMLNYVPSINETGFHQSSMKFPWSKLFDMNGIKKNLFGFNFMMNWLHLHESDSYYLINNHIFFTVVIYSLCRLVKKYQASNVIPIRPYSSILYKHLRKFDRKMSKIGQKMGMIDDDSKPKIKPTPKQARLLKMVKATKTKINLPD